MPVFRTRSVKTTLAAAFAAFVYLGMSAAFMATAQAQPETVTNNEQRTTSNFMAFDIPAQPLSEALSEFARQSGQQLLYSPDVTEGRTSTAIQGDFRPDTALDRLLQGTEQGFAYTPSGAILVGDPTEIQRRISQMNGTSQAPGQNTIGQRRPGIEEIIVTGQKREERIQDVPIAITAFSPEQLEAQKIEGGFDLLKGVPNVTFSKTNFSGYNFQIRGIGTQAVSATTDPAVAVSFNSTTLIVNRLFEQEYLDVERVEVLRGPQGTLFGRNATSGVINVISNKPEMGVWDGMFDLEVGNYNTRRLRGFFNAPIGEEFAIRGAYASTQRDGFGINEAANDPNRQFGDDVSEDVDGRDLWTGRLSLGWQPNDRFRANLIWERFEEDDNRVRTSKQLCHNDPGVSGDQIGGFEWPNPIMRANTSQGCLPGSLYSDGAYETPNGASLPYVSGLFWGTTFGAVGFVGSGQLGLGENPYQTGQNPGGAPCELVTNSPVFYSFNLCQPDPYAGQRQSRDLRTIYSQLEPEYRATADILEFSFDFQVSDDITFTSQTVYATDEYYATQDYNRYSTFPIFNDSTLACGQMVVSGKTQVDCSDDPDTGVGTYASLTDTNGDGIADQTGYPINDDPLRQEPGNYTVDGSGFVRDADGRRVGFYRDLLPGGIYQDPQLGESNTLVAQDLSEVKSRQFNQEFRVVSDFAAPWNFSLGANFTHFETKNDYYVFVNTATMLTHFFPLNTHLGCYQASQTNPLPCLYVDPNPLGEHDGEGHNYFRSANPYELKSTAIFGELYWRATETVKFTAGLRLTWDEKRFTPIPSQLLLADYRLNVPEGAGPEACIAPDPCQLRGTGVNGRGSPPNPDIVQEWREPTGRFVVDWQPLLDFTDETLVYASFSHGYKGGGANPPIIAPPAGEFQRTKGLNAVPPTFEPEYVNAYELGTKNTLFGGGLTLNATVFYYDYTDYQISKIVDRSAANENFDAETYGAELELLFAPNLNWQFNAAIGWLRTEVADGERSIDLMDRTQGGDQFHITQVTNPNFDPSLDPRPRSEYIAGLETPEGDPIPADQEFLAYDRWFVNKPFPTYSSNCVAPLDLLEVFVENYSPLNLSGFCPTGQIAGNTTEPGGLVETPPGIGFDPSRDAPNRGAGFFADLSGNELPQAPEFTVALGGQYNFDLTRDWRATARIDYYWQDKSYARIYNTEYDRLKSWSNTNLSFWVNNPVNGITVEAYVKNLFDETPITGSFLNSDDSGLTTNVFTLEPRLIGVSVRKEF